MSANPHQLSTVDAVREIIGQPNPLVPLKVMESLDEMSVAFIHRSPFLVLATVGQDGLPDVSPKGDAPGFVAVENPTTLLIPDRKGNRLIFGHQNILANPKIAVIFMVPGTEETLRVQGQALLISDPDVLQRLSAEGRPALLAIRLTVERCYFHCAKAFKRSKLWKPEVWPPRQHVSFGKQLAPKMGGGDDLAKEIDDLVEADYKDNM
jgi:PPOX class probable FMN-dependent enzyme